MIQNIALYNSVTPNKNNNRNYTFDIFKLLLSFLIVIKHTNSSYRAFLDPLTTCAVPLFFMISGYFVFQHGLNINKIKMGGVRMIKIFIYSTIFYFVIRLLTKGVYQPSVKDLLLLICCNNERAMGHLWYLSAYAYVLFLLYIVVKFKIKPTVKIIKPVVLVILGIYFLCDFIYIGVTEERNITFVYLFRNWFFTGIPCFFLGSLFSLYKREFHQKTLLKASLALSMCALIEIHIFHPIHIADVFFTTLPLSVCIFLLVKQTHVSNPNLLSCWGQRYSLYIYIFHPLWCDVIFKSCLYNCEHSPCGKLFLTLSPLIVFLLTLIISITFVKFKNYATPIYSSKKHQFK